MKSTGRVKTTTVVHIDTVVSHILWRMFELFNAHVGDWPTMQWESSLCFRTHRASNRRAGLCKRKGLFIFLALDKRRFPTRSDNSHEAKNFKRRFHPPCKNNIANLSYISQATLFSLLLISLQIFCEQFFMEANPRCEFSKASLYDRKILHRLLGDSYGKHICPRSNRVGEHRFYVAFTLLLRFVHYRLLWHLVETTTICLSEIR